MVSYRSVTATLVSVPDVKPIHEYSYPHPDAPTAPSPSELSDPFVDDDVPETAGDFSFTAPSKASAPISVFALSPPAGSNQFWVHYKIAPPYPPKAQYYFKMFVDGTLILSWGFGHKEGFRGSVRFVPSASGEQKAKTFHLSKAQCDHHSAEDSSLELSRPSSSSSWQANALLTPSVAIKVYRAKGRKETSIPTEQDMPDLPPRYSTSVNLVPSSKLPERHPRKYYNYSLVDPVGSPFATFQYYFKTSEELRNYGIDLSSPINIGSLPSTPSTQSIMSLSQSNSNNSLDQPRGARGSQSSHDFGDEPHFNKNEYGKSTGAFAGFTHTWRPLSSISERDNESPDATPTQRSLAAAYRPSDGNLRAKYQPEMTSNELLTPIKVAASVTWPLDTSKPLPDPPSEATPRPRGGQGSSHNLLITRFPKFASSSTIASTTTLNSTISDAPSDPFLSPSSPLGRGDPLPILELSGGLRSHPVNRNRPTSWEPKSLGSPRRGGALPSPSLGKTYANVLDEGGLQRSDSISSVGRAVSRPDNQRPPTPVGPALPEPSQKNGTNEAAYLPRLGTPPVFFPQPEYGDRPSSESDSGAILGTKLTRPTLSERPTSSPVIPSRHFPVRKSSLTKFRPNRSRFQLKKSSNMALRVSSPMPILAPAPLPKRHIPSPNTIDDPETPSPRIRADLSKFFGTDIYPSARNSSDSNLVKGSGGRLRKKGSFLAMGKDMWDNVKKGIPKERRDSDADDGFGHAIALGKHF